MNTEEIRAAVDEYLEREGITVEFRQINKYEAENVDKEYKHSNAFWRATITSGRASMTVQYSEGEGNFLKQRVGKVCIADHKIMNEFKELYLDRCVRNGVVRWFEQRNLNHFLSEFAKKDRVKKVSTKGGTRKLQLVPPAPADLLYCLCMECDVMDSGGFEEWARDYGYDQDSRKAEKIYNLCIEQSLKLRSVLGEKRINELRELIQDM